MNFRKSNNIKTIFFSFCFFLSSCSNQNLENWSNYCYEDKTDNSCDKITFDELYRNAHKYENKCIEIEGYVSLKFEDVAIYNSKHDRTSLNSKHAYWLNFNDSIIKKIESAASRFDKQNVTVKGLFTNKKKGHLNSYAGELETVFCIRKN